MHMFLKEVLTTPISKLTDKSYLRLTDFIMMSSISYFLENQKMSIFKTGSHTASDRSTQIDAAKDRSIECCYRNSQ